MNFATKFSYSIIIYYKYSRPTKLLLFESLFIFLERSYKNSHASFLDLRIPITTFSNEGHTIFEKALFYKKAFTRKTPKIWKNFVFWPFLNTKSGRLHFPILYPISHFPFSTKLFVCLSACLFVWNIFLNRTINKGKHRCLPLRTQMRKYNFDVDFLQ